MSEQNNINIIKGTEHTEEFDKRLDRPKLRICKTNPYHDAPDSACEGIYEAGKEAQLEADKELIALFPDIEEAKKQERKVVGLELQLWMSAPNLINPYRFVDRVIEATSKLLKGQALKETE